MRITIPDRPADFIVTAEDCGQWTAHIGEHYRAYLNTSNMSECVGRECHFFRRGECFIDGVGHHCVPPYFWRKIDKDGNVLDRDGWVMWTKEQSDKIESYNKPRKKK